MSVLKTEQGLLCRRDGNLMYLVYESEKTNDGKIRVVISFKCPACGYKVELESMGISKTKDGVQVLRSYRPL